MSTSSLNVGGGGSIQMLASVCALYTARSASPSRRSESTQVSLLLCRFEASEAAKTASSAAPSLRSNVLGAQLSRKSVTADASTPRKEGNSGRFCFMSYASNAFSACAISKRQPARRFFTAASNLAVGSDDVSGLSVPAHAAVKSLSASVSASHMTFLMNCIRGRGSPPAGGCLYMSIALVSIAFTRSLPPPHSWSSEIASEMASIACAYCTLGKPSIAPTFRISASKT
mmetsp:Transcript_4701/g.11667  ORF Transcript_4701/g.11667 Transcript_4701/m.11667 type:complete len:229 (+) Transcript_4701:2176-2862(+)